MLILKEPRQERRGEKLQRAELNVSRTYGAFGELMTSEFISL